MKTMFIFNLFFLVFLFNSNNSLMAQDKNNSMSVEGLLKICLAEKIAVEAEKTFFDEMFCHGYLQAIHDSYYDGLDGKMPYKICVPNGVTRKELAKTFTNTALFLIDEDAEIAQLHASAFVYSIFVTSYPCSSK